MATQAGYYRTSQTGWEKKILTDSAVATMANQYGLPVTHPKNKQELTDILVTGKFSFGIVVAYGRIIPSDAIKAVPKGLINVHGSLLPKYRGASPVQAAILAGDTITGLSYMLIEPGLDTGPVFARHELKIDANDTTPALLSKMAELTNKTLTKDLKAYLNGERVAEPQDSNLASRTGLIKKTDGEVNLKTISPIDLDRKFRAFTPWPGIYTEEFGQRLIIKEGYLKGGQFVINRLQWAGKKPVSAKTFVQGWSDILTQLPKTIRIDAIN